MPRLFHPCLQHQKTRISCLKKYGGMLLAFCSFSQGTNAAEPPTVAVHSARIDSAFVPFDSRWDFAAYINWRPANGQPATINPPRFSWPVVPWILAKGFSDHLPRYEYVFELSQDPAFPAGEKTIVKRAVTNFENALPVLSNGTWYWRIGYALPGAVPETWGVTRSFSIAPGIFTADRTGIDRAASDLAKLPRPRLAPADGDWQAFRHRLEANPLSANVLNVITAEAEETLKTNWWKNFPENDTGNTTDQPARIKLTNQFREISWRLSRAAFLCKLTGDARFQPAFEYALRAAKFPIGGETSPEYHNNSPVKWSTRWVHDLAYIYDLGWNEYTPAERAAFREGIDQRIAPIFFKRSSWQNEDGTIRPEGIAGFTESHAFENALRATPAILLLAGESSLADQLTPVMLNYLLGVGGEHGEEEGWNEVGSYAFFKPAHSLDAALIANKLLPGLRIAEYPWFAALADVHTQLAAPGMKRQGMGDYTTDMNGLQLRRDFAHLLHLNAALTNSAIALNRLNTLDTAYAHLITYNSFIPMLIGYGAPSHVTPADAPDIAPTTQFLREAGWFFVSNRSPSLPNLADEAVRLFTLARPRGAFSHSHSHDGAFVWQAYGTTLSAGGGSTIFADPYTRSTFSHNGILINGHGESFRGFSSPNPIGARPLYWKQDTASGTVQWAADMTGAFLISQKDEARNAPPYLRKLPTDRGAPGLQRWIRHYVFFNNRDMVMVDDLAMREDADPAKFTWLFHIPYSYKTPEINIESDDASGLRARYVMDDVEATVRQYTSVPVEVTRLGGRDAVINPISKTDYASVIEAMRAYRSSRTLTDVKFKPSEIPYKVILATTKPVKEARFITVLTARPEKENVQADVTLDANRVTLTRDGKTSEIAIDAANAAEANFINIPVSAVRDYAEASDPYRLPPSGTTEKIAGTGTAPMQIEWLRRDTFANSSWVNRWWVENQGALVRGTPEAGLEIRQDKGGTEAGTTLWLRADAPERLAVRIRTQGTNQRARAGKQTLSLILRARETSGQNLQWGTRTGTASGLQNLSSYTLMLSSAASPDAKGIYRNPNFLQTAVFRGPASSLENDNEWLCTFDQGRIRLWLNGRLVNEWTDANPLPNGKPGIHLSNTNLNIRSVEIGRISP